MNITVYAAGERYLDGVHEVKGDQLHLVEEKNFFTDWSHFSKGSKAFLKLIQRLPCQYVVSPSNQLLRVLFSSNEGRTRTKIVIYPNELTVKGHFPTKSGLLSFSFKGKKKLHRLDVQGALEDSGKLARFLKDRDQDKTYPNWELLIAGTLSDDGLSLRANMIKSSYREGIIPKRGTPDYGFPILIEGVLRLEDGIYFMDGFSESRYVFGVEAQRVPIDEKQIMDKISSYVGKKVVVSGMHRLRAKPVMTSVFSIDTYQEILDRCSLTLKGASSQ
tara:strand:+ start:491 stop:1315 length:825 start_codon:yes stop_codon:yes gene_type:complete